MNWHDLLHIDLGALLRGKTEILPAPRKRTDPQAPENVAREFVMVPVRRGADLLRMAGGSVRASRRFNLIVVTDQLARIVACNAPLVPAIDAIMEDAPKWRVWRVLFNLRVTLAQGASLSDAMRAQPRFFPGWYIDLVQAGENTGALYPVLADLSNNLSESSRVRSSLHRGLAYLAALFVFSCLMMTFIGLKIFPVFNEILNDFGIGSDVFFLAAFKGCSNFLVFLYAGRAWGIPHFIILPLLIALAAVVLKVTWRSKRGALAWGSLALAIPFVRGLVVQSNLAHAARVLEKLLCAGYPVDEALESAAGSDINPVFGVSLRRMRERVRQGETLSDAAERETWALPASFRGLVALGESSGRLPEALDRIAHLYQQRVLKVIHMLLSVLFPIGVMAMGCWVLVVYAMPFRAMIAIVDGMLASM